MRVELQVNGRHVEGDVEPRCSLLDCLREDVGLKGTHAGCEHGVCGACTILVDGEPARSCLMLAVRDAVTAASEDLETVGDLHASAAYRKRVAATLARRAILDARDEAAGGRHAR